MSWRRPLSRLWCRTGAPKIAAFALLLFALLALASFGGCGLLTAGNEAKPSAPKCENAAHCDDANPCTIDLCGEDGLCAATPVNGPPPAQLSGDCMVVTCAEGSPVTTADDTDVDDGNACTTDACQSGTPTHTDADGSPCVLGSGSGVCKAGACVVSCVSADDSCDDANPCTEDACDVKLGACVHDTAKLHGTLLSDRDLGDCTEQRCKTGVATTVPDDSEVPDDKNDCTADSCKAGAKVHDDIALDATCGLAGGMYCNGMGECVQCNDPTQCGVDDDCNTFTCKASICGDDYTPAGTTTTAQTPFDCQIAQCNGSGGITSADANGDLPDDDNDCTNDICTAGIPSHTNVGQGAACMTVLGPGACDGNGVCRKSLGSICATGFECSTGFCADSRCCESACGTACKSCALTGLLGTCSNIAQFGEDMSPANACVGVSSCDGNGACRKDNGQTCALAGDCSSGSCVDGRCCNNACTGTCMACNVAGLLGTCSNIPQLTEDMFPANECVGVSSCDGNGNCRKDNGQTCAAAVECSSGNCIDGRCCNNACGTACRACNVAGLEGTCSNIPQLTEDMFPVNACVGVSSCDGNGNCRKDNGQTCSAANECSSGNCVDGRCCDGACSTACKACNVAGLLGTCSNLPVLVEDMFPANACVGASSCDGNGNCRKDNGQTCAAVVECSSGNCVDGRCCDGACTGTCKACNVAGLLGTCSNIPQLTEDMFPANVCVGVSSCDGNGNCRKDNGQTCAAAVECSSGNCVDGRCCDGACTGTCKACNVAGLLGTCSNIPQLTEDMFPANVCVGVSSCDGNGNCRKDNGQTCSAAVECSSGNCVDGRCCDGACSTACKACNVAGLLGTCSNLPVLVEDMFPANACVGASSCDGNGNCRKDNGQTCSAAVECSSGNCVDGRCCDGACTGTCKACNVAGLLGTCSNIPQLAEDMFPANTCVGANSCDGAGSCTKDNGQTCSMASQCSSGNCVDSVCCDSACAGPCSACSMAKKGSGVDGTCGLVAAGSDPDDDCALAAAATCGNDGTCNSAGACRKHVAGTVCLASTCMTGTQQNASTCDGAGTCNMNGTTLCSPYQCDLDGDCATMCDLDGDCAAGFFCSMAGQCEAKKPDGILCGGSNECSSAACTEGVCCNTTCLGECRSCLGSKTMGPDGLCGVVPGGSDPDDECLLTSAASCGTTGVCNAMGECAKHPAGTVCIDASCSLGTQQAEGTCDGMGTCDDPGMTPCDPYLCGTSACEMTCAIDTDCVDGYYCNGGMCAAQVGNGQACDVDNECLSDFCTDGFCCSGACDLECESCAGAKTGGANGACLPVLQNQPDDMPLCDVLMACDGARVCKAANGKACGVNSDCASNSCVGGPPGVCM